MVQRIFQLSYRYAPLVIGVFLLLTALSIWAASGLKIDVSTDKLIPQDSPARATYESIREEFGSDRMAVVFIEDKALFSPEKLATLKELHLELKALKQVQRPENLFTANNIHGDGGWVDTSPLMQSVPTTQGEADKRKALAQHNPLLLSSVISEDANATLITLYLEPSEEDPSTLDREIYTQIEAVLAKYDGAFDQLFQVGSPALHVWMSDFILNDQVILLPLAMLILVGLIGLMMGSLQASIIPVLNAIIATALTFGFMAWMGIPVSMLNYIVPALILIIGATEDVHILTEYRECREDGLTGISAIDGIARRIGLTLILTGITTTLGFAVTGLNAITIMEEFGLCAAFGMAARFFVSLVFLPAYLRFFGKWIKAHPHGSEEEAKHRRLAARFSRFIMTRVVTNPLKVIAVFVLIAIPCLLMIPSIRVSNDLISFLKEDSPIRKKLDMVADRLSGSKVIYVTLKGEPGDYKQVKKLKQVEALVLWLRERGDLDKVIAHTDMLALVNQAMFGGEDTLRVPDTDPLVAQYLMFFHRSTLQPYVSGDYAKANIVIRADINDSMELNQLVAEIRDALASGSYGFHDYSVTGKSVMVAAAVDKIITGQVMSLGSMIAFLFIIVALLFLSWKAGLITVLANAFAIVGVFGLMSLTGIPLNVGTCMVAAISIGIAVDDTLHLMVRYNKELKVKKDELPAIAASVRAEFFPVLTTSLGLAGGFLVLSMSSFVPVMQFGLLSAFVMGLAFVADIILTPVLLSTTRLITLWDVIGFNLRKALLESSTMFRGMTKWQAKKLILLANIEDCEPGKSIIKEGELGSRMYVVIDGEFEVSKSVSGEKMHISTLALGDVVGEVALVSRVRRTADVTAQTKGKLLVLDWESLLKLQRSSPYLASKLFLNLSRILGARLNDSLSRMSTRNPFPPNGND